MQKFFDALFRDVWWKDCEFYDYANSESGQKLIHTLRNGVYAAVPSCLYAKVFFLCQYKLLLYELIYQVSPNA